MGFASIQPAPPDPILGLTEAFKKDTNPKKVNLGVGVYVDDTGKTPLLASVRMAEEALLKAARSKSYLPIAGDPAYGKHVQDLLFGAGHEVGADGRAATSQTPGGTGALRVGAEFLKVLGAPRAVWVSSPTWPNHNGIFSAAGHAIREYPYYDGASRGLDFAGMKRVLETVPEGDVVLLHVCCHNPTGVDLSRDQWAAVADIAKKNRWIPFLDFAYQGFGEGLEPDRAGLLPMALAGLDFLVASSFSKNFGLYCERAGALTLVAGNAKVAEAAFSQVKATIRKLYSNPPAHGGLIVSHILGDAALRAQWEREVAAMRDRINGVRRQFTDALKKRNAPMDFSFIEKQRGMFSFSGLTDAQVTFLREKKGIYMVGGGRMNVAGIMPGNVDYVCDSIIEAMR